MNRITNARVLTKGSGAIGSRCLVFTSDNIHGHMDIGVPINLLYLPAINLWYEKGMSIEEVRKAVRKQLGL